MMFWSMTTKGRKAPSERMAGEGLLEEVASKLRSEVCDKNASAGPLKETSMTCWGT